MYNLLIAAAISVVAFLLPLAFGFPWYAGVAPAGIVFPAVAWVLTARTGRQVQAALVPLQARMADLQGVSSQAEAQRILSEVGELIEDVKARYGKWQLLLERQLDAQLGMLDYMQAKFDDALPRLEAAFRDWTATTAAGCIHFRRERDAEAWKAFEAAEGYAAKEPQVYMVHAILRERRGDRSGALEVLTRGLEATGGSAKLKDLHGAVANKRRIDTSRFGETWQRFFPEELAQQMMVRGRRGPPPPNAQFQQGPPPPKVRGKLARRR